MFSVMVTGSRNWNKVKIIEDELSLVNSLHKEILLIEGSSKGADLIAKNYAIRNNWKVKSYPAEWNKYGKAAGPIRNKQMLDCKPDLILAFPTKESVGTKGVIRMAREKGLNLKVIEG